MNNTNNYTVQEDEIDIRELFRTLVKHKIKIALITLAITLAAVVYTLINNPTPVFKGNVLVEIGEIQNENVGSSHFDNPNNLAVIVSNQFKNISASTPKGTTILVELTSLNSDKELIKSSLKRAISFILERHKTKASFHTKYTMTKQIGDINIDSTPTNVPKKKLVIVVAFVTGLILSIFFVFFLEFIRAEKEQQ
jgi:LPS O-antigen subunit length determinant protein (WzzB/FepE family)